MRVIGEFETHLTVRCRGEEDIDALARWADDHGLKFAHIVLDRGRVPSQPMLTRRTTGTFAQARAAARRAADDLRAGGFTVTRTKIEAAPWNEGVPASDADADAGGPYYFEHHIKLLLEAGDDTAALAASVAPHAAHLSRNARRVRADGRRERFVTQRCHGVGARTAGRRLDALTAVLRAQGLDIASVEREFVVFDDDVSLDDGWITEAAP
ncbi:hypothetical protein ABZ801_26880 [Actinomadura sp. NPDC047616]|uniref:hypothetical protein n=1 Tax=Actinomadura sp. NPDC047616 TaxID=3155914 RepID=UPI0033E39307